MDRHNKYSYSNLRGNLTPNKLLSHYNGTQALDGSANRLLNNLDILTQKTRNFRQDKLFLPEQDRLKTLIRETDRLDNMYEAELKRERARLLTEETSSHSRMPSRDRFRGTPKSPIAENTKPYSALGVQAGSANKYRESKDTEYGKYKLNNLTPSSNSRPYSYSGKAIEQSKNNLQNGHEANGSRPPVNPFKVERNGIEDLVAESQQMIKQLNRTIENLKEDKASITRQHQEEKRILHEKLQRLQKERHLSPTPSVSSLGISQHSPVLIYLQKELEEVRIKLGKTQTTNQKLSQNINDKDEQLRRLERELQLKKNELVEVQKIEMKKAKAEEEQRNKQARKMEEKKQSLQSYIAAQNQRKQKIAELKVLQSEMQAHIERLRTKYEAQTKDMEGSMRDRQHKLQQLDLDIHNRIVENESRKKDLVEQSLKYEALKRQVAEGIKQLEENKQEIQVKRQELEERHRQNMKREQQINEQTYQNASKSQKIESDKERVEELQRLTSQLLSLENQYRQLASTNYEGKISEENKKIETLAQRVAEVERIAQQVSERQIALDNQRRRVQQQESQLRQRQQRANAERTYIEEKMRQAEKERDRLNQVLDKIENSKAKIQSLNAADIQSQMRQITGRQSELDSMRAKLAEDERAYQVQKEALQFRLEKLREEQLTQQEEQASAKAKEPTITREDFQQQQLLIDMFNRKCEQVNLLPQGYSLVEQFQQIQRSINEAKKEHEGILQKIESAKQDLNIFGDGQRSMKEQIQQLQSQKDLIENQIKEKNEQIRSLAHEEQQTRKRKDQQIEIRREAVERELADKQAEISKREAELRAANEELEARTADLQNQIKLLEQSRVSISKSIEEPIMKQSLVVSENRSSHAGTPSDLSQALLQIEHLQTQMYESKRQIQELNARLVSCSIPVRETEVFQLLKTTLQSLQRADLSEESVEHLRGSIQKLHDRVIANRSLVDQVKNNLETSAGLIQSEGVAEWVGSAVSRLQEASQNMDDLANQFESVLK